MAVDYSVLFAVFRYTRYILRTISDLIGFASLAMVMFMVRVSVTVIVS